MPMNKKLITLDLICYGVIPFFIWNYGREPLGDYIAILLSTVPGFIYTVYRFAKEKQLNIAGIFVITSLFISTTVNLLSTSANSMLWNQVYLGFGFGIIFLMSTVIKKPLALYFAVDVAYLQGYSREDSTKLYKLKGLFLWFQLVNLLFVFRSLSLNSLKAFLLQTYGTGGYDKVIIYMNIIGWMFSGLIFLAFLFVNSKIVRYLEQLENEKEEYSASIDTK